MTFIQLSARTISIAAALALLAVLTIAATAPEPDEATYRDRFTALMRDGGVVTRYDPMEKVQGAVAVRPLPNAPVAARSISADALKAATDYAASNRSSAFMVWRNGALQTHAYFGDTTGTTPLLSKSLSKPLTALAIGRAIALRKIRSLDQPVADFLPEWHGTPKAAILIRHLLDMRSGLMEQMFSTDPDHPINRAYISPDHGRYLVDHYPLVALPGSKYLYNNATSELVAVVIERATKRRYAEFIGKEILQPIGALGGEIWIDRPGGLAHSGCCMRLPAESWLRMGILLLHDGIVGGRRLLPNGYVAAMTTGTVENPHYGLGVWVAGPYAPRRGFQGPGRAGPQVLHSEPYLDRDLFLFDGNGDQVVYISRATNMVVLRLGEAPPKTPEWDNVALPNILMRGIITRRGEKPPVPQPR